jgi:histidine ammonia-lyase
MPTSKPPVRLDGAPLLPGDIRDIARAARAVELPPETRNAVEGTRAALESAASSGATHYGINTGFGKFSRQRIEPTELRELQANLVRSHAAGVGSPLPAEIVRAMMVVLAASLCRCRSGVRPVVIETLVGLVNAGITPVVPESGSVGASGDLAPLAHVALALIGEGEVSVGDAEPGPAGEAMAAAGIPPSRSRPRRGWPSSTART